MRLRLSRTSIIVGMLFGLAGGTVWAQSDADQALQGVRATTTKEKVEFAHDVVAEMEAGVKSAKRLLDTAEKGGDIDQVTCVRDKLASLVALHEVTIRAQGAMTEALAANQVERADHELRKVGVAASKFRQFRDEAGACLGEPGTVVGTTEIEVSQEAVTDEGDTDPLVPAFDWIEDPPNTSPFE